MALPEEPQARPRRNRLAIVSLVLGILSVAFAQFCINPGTISAVGCLGVPVALGALVTGVLGIRTAQALDGQGKRLAIGGLLTAAIGLLIFLAMFSVIMLTPGGLMAHAMATPTPTITPRPTFTPTPTVTPTPTPPPTPTPSPQTYRGESFEITFTDEWEMLDTSRIELCQQPSVECLFLNHASERNLLLRIIRITYNYMPDLEEEEEMLFQQFESGSLVSKERIKVGGQTAIQRVFVVQLAYDQVFMMHVVVVDGYDVYWFLLEAPSNEVLTQYQAEVETIITSARFTSSGSTSAPTPTSPPAGYVGIQGDRFALLYPEEWREVNTDGEEVCRATNVLCFAVEHPTTPDVGFLLTRYTRNDTLDVEVADQSFWEQIIVPSYETVELLEEVETTEIDGQTAIRRVYQGTLSSGEQRATLQFILTDGYDVYHLAGFAPDADTLAAHQAEIEEIILSFRLTD